MVIHVVSAAPVLNSVDFEHAYGGPSGTQIPRNKEGHPLYNEFVALPGMRFDLDEEFHVQGRTIFRVRTKAYHAPSLYIDSRFTDQCSERMSEGCLKKPSLPSREEVLAGMEQLIGTQYVWGGNWSRGISELLLYYPPKGPIDEETATLWTWTGVDCSGLLYEVTGGATPRNTSDLVRYGTAVPVSGLSVNELVVLLRPLDLIVWPGHVLFVFDGRSTIESRARFGVIRSDLRERFAEIFETRTGANEWNATMDPKRWFVVRRIFV